jgi:hypothetical protein
MHSAEDTIRVTCTLGIHVLPAIILYGLSRGRTPPAGVHASVPVQ